MSVPFFSIILPTYNRASFLSRSIGSVIDQDYHAWELILIDDGSTDHTKEVVNSFKDNRIKYVYQENSERSAARNNGINQAQGAWLCFLDSDDEYNTNHLSNLLEFIKKENPSLGLIATGLLIDNGNLSIKKDFLDLQANLLEEIGRKFLLPSQVCVHRTILSNEKFDARFRLWEDTHLWLRIAAQYPVYQIEKYTVTQHVHNDGTVVQGMKKVRVVEVNQYVSAILDLKINHASRFEGKLPPVFFDQYVDSKYRMYLYRARQNKQFRVAMVLCWKGMINQPSSYYLAEFVKIFANQFNVGIHE
jgi:glycosyltransferase involved in cell wall biosynthesis